MGKSTVWRGAQPVGQNAGTRQPFRLLAAYVCRGLRQPWCLEVVACNIAGEQCDVVRSQVYGAKARSFFPERHQQRLVQQAVFRMVAVAVAALFVVPMLMMQVRMAVRMLFVAEETHEANDGNHLFVVMMMGNDGMCQQTDVGKNYKENSRSFPHRFM